MPTLRYFKFRVWNMGFKRDVELENVKNIFHNENLIVEVFTGLWDKNGVEIYEGDILSCENECDCVVRLEKGRFKLVKNENESVALEAIDLSNVAVVGNIQENEYF